MDHQHKPTQHAQSPLLPPEDEQTQSANREEHELHFFDSEAILCIKKEVALGYLILLTGGEFKYTPPPKAGENSVPPDATQSQESRDLAYASLVDGNVLYPCFGLRAAANGRPNDNILGNTQKSSIFCCFPSQSLVDSLLAPRLSRNRLELQNLIEVLREVREIHFDDVESNSGANNKPDIPLKVIRAYVSCFTCVVRYHDLRESIEKKEKKSGKMNEFRRLFFPKRDSSDIESLKIDTIKDMQIGFDGLWRDISDSCEKAAAATTLTGLSEGPL